MLQKTIKEILLLPQAGLKVTVNGWIRTRRDAKGFSFLELNDGSCLTNLQIIAPQSMAGYQEVLKISTGASVTVEGILKESPGAKQKFEVEAQEILTLEPHPPIILFRKKGTVSNSQEIAHLRPEPILLEQLPDCEAL
jgi:asparaginyl-tRNA synthetase